MILIDIFISKIGEVELDGAIEAFLDPGTNNIAFSDGTVLEATATTEPVPADEKADKDKAPATPVVKVTHDFHHKGHSFKGLISDSERDNEVLAHYRVEGNVHWASVNGELHKFFI